MIWRLTHQFSGCYCRPSEESGIIGHTIRETTDQSGINLRPKGITQLNHDTSKQSPKQRPQVASQEIV